MKDDNHLTYEAWLDKLRRARAKGKPPEVVSLSWAEAVELGYCDPSETIEQQKQARRRMN